MTDTRQKDPNPMESNEKNAHGHQATGRKHNFFHRNWLILAVLAVAGVALLSGFSPWHGGPIRGLFSGDPAKVEAALSEIQSEVADELDIRPEQEAAFNAFAEKMKDRARAKISSMGPLRTQMHAEVAKDAPDVDQLAALAKQMVRMRPPADETDAMIDDVVAFYKTLDADQQAKVLKRMKKHGRWHH